MAGTASDRNIFHGSAVVLESGGREPSAVLLRGNSGTGKSDLAFRLIEAGGKLLSDDQVALSRRQDKIYAGAVDAIRGLIEVRGVGLLKYPVAGQTRLRLVVDLVPHKDMPRLPEWETTDILGVGVPRLKLHAFDVSTTHKIFKAVEILHAPEMVVR